LPYLSGLEIALILFHLSSPLYHLAGHGALSSHPTSSHLIPITSHIWQDTVLFNESVRFNLCYGAPHASDEQIAAACALARVDSFISSVPDPRSNSRPEHTLSLLCSCPELAT
jgi:ABC-type transport system involved in cytochrome bd biosynthesis fused ATPase/permease subunit